ncbi:hypothetical protein Nepgr_003033 [Nepenthes gracilis]|uniref:Telomere length regulation protein conserved domain-containing protein n=1 Tax=Nepenthes gracilis TaxID=150966 RepID=A0AAD3RYS3_NEPGR|nr:hypothetical protein Nepgr_003033 [Nepenthes gracilis]
MEGEKPKTEKEMEIELLRKISDTMSAINSAKRVDDIVCALHSLAVLIFPVDTHFLSGVISERYKDKLFNVEIPSVQERRNQWQVFYQGTAFPALSRLLLYDVASDWLSCFPLSARKLVYDVFFANGLTSEVVLAVIPCLEHSGGDGHDANAVRSNAERLLELCLLENDGVSKMAREFSAYHVSKDFNSALLKPDLLRVAQLVASIPDKTRLKAPKSLSSHLFFKEITIQLLTAAEGENKEICDKSVISHRMEGDGTILFIAELFARICRRGSADLLISEVITRILRCLRSFLLPKRESLSKDAFMSEPSFRFWFMIMELIVDQYAVERMADQILRQLACEHASDAEAYWSLWILFHRLLEHQSSMRFLFVEKFVLWKVFPFCCLRWILQFSVLERPPDAVMLTKGEKNSRLLDTVQHLVEVWAKQEFVQSAPIEQQAYITAALGLLLEKMSREELESTKDVMRSILEGVSCRLQYPSDLVRRMASSIALAFSIVIDPKNPLYLDDNCTSEVIDWEFGLVTPKEGTLPTMNGTTKGMDNMASLMTAEQVKELDHTVGNEAGSKGKVKSKKLFQFKLVDPDEIVDPATFNDDPVSEEEQDDNASEDSETSTDPSLQPYDLSDDDSDLKGRFTQLVDVVGALRKSDDPDGVERALDVAENLVRASADELQHVAPDLVRTLVQVRCSDAALQGEEESAEEKRQKALVALLVTCPFESLDSVNKLIYSPHVDVSQRIMILDVMTNAAQELANTKTVNQKYQLRPLISSAAETQPWFFPSNKGPHGAGSWKEISDKETPLNWSYRYERELPSKPGQIKKGKTRRWSRRPMNMLASEMETSLNKFPLYAAAFMLPAMHGFDKKRHGVDLLGRDFIVLGKLIHMLGVCMKCTALHPEASALAPHLLDMLSSREICHHKEAYVRRSVLFAASSILMALHPSYVVSALIEGNQEIARGLEWIRTWALHVAESDIDRDCYTLAMACLQLHAEMALQASRALESTETTSQAKSIGIPPNMSKGTIKIPGSNSSFLS